MKEKKKLKYVLLPGEGIGKDLAKTLAIIEQGIHTIEFEPVLIDKFRLETTTGEQGALDPVVIEKFRTIPVGMKGPTRTLQGKGPQSANVALRMGLDLHTNIRPAVYFEGAISPLKKPEDINVVIFRQNTEDIYMGLEIMPGTEKMKKFLKFIREELGYPLEQYTDQDEIGGGIKLISRKASEKIMEAALRYAIENGNKRIAIMHKANIAKATEGSFMNWCLKYANDNYRDQVYFYYEEEGLNQGELEKLHASGKIRIEVITADDTFAQLISDPKRFELIVTTNLNGDYISDLAAAAVGGVPVAAGGNIGDDCAIFEAIGGTADKLEDKNLANPTAFILSYAMMLEYKGFHAEAIAIRLAVEQLFASGIGTGDMKFSTRLSTSEFAEQVRDRVAQILVKQDEAVEA